MIVSFEQKVQTNSHITQPQHYQYDDKKLKRGELFGWFEMGSTILLFSPKGTFAPDLSINQKLKFADPIGRTQTP
jgi:phosphatidylserine decarboxylase